MHQPLLKTCEMFKKQPKIEVKPTPFESKLILIGWILVGFNFLLAFYASIELSERIPIHFNLSGEPDGFGDKSAVWAAPIIGLLIYWGMNLITSKIKPWNFNYPVKVTAENAEILYKMGNRMIAIPNFGMAFLFLLITLHIIVTSKGFEQYTSWLFWPSVIFLTVFPFYIIFKMLKFSK